MFDTTWFRRPFLVTELLGDKLTRGRGVVLPPGPGGPLSPEYRGEGADARPRRKRAKSLRGRRAGRRVRKGASRSALRLEPLEDRRLLSVFYDLDAIATPVPPTITSAGAVRWSNTSGCEEILATAPSGSRYTIASTSSLSPGTKWDSLGVAPAISPDGSVVVFAGNRGSGPGVFAVVDEGAGFGDVIRVAGEDVVDNNPYDAQPATGNFELGYNADGDGIYLSSIDVNGTFGVERMFLNGGDSFDDDCFVVTFVGTPSEASIDNPTLASMPLLFSAAEGIWSVRVDCQNELNSTTFDRVFHPTSPIPVVQVGDTWNGAAITKLKLYEPIAPADTDPDGAPRVIERGDHYLSFTATTSRGDQVVRAAHLDTDGDGLLDHWERSGGGIDINQDGEIDLNLSAMGASPNHKDLFLEIDWLADQADHQHAPAPLVTLDLVTMFEQAPVSNPDGIDGIRLHVDAGSGKDAYDLPYSQNMGSGSLQGGDEIGMPGDATAHVDVVTFAFTTTLAEVPGLNTRSFESIKDNFFGTTDKRARELAFRYGVFADFWACYPGNSAPLYGTVSAAVGATLTVHGTPFSGYSTADLKNHAVGVVSATGQFQFRTIEEWSDDDQIIATSAFDPVPQDGDTFVLLSGYSGIAEADFYADPDNNGLPGNDLLVTTGALGLTADTAREIQWRTLAHELGHTMGLRHGGVTMDDSITSVAPFSYLSLMNYQLQLKRPITTYVEENADRTLRVAATPFAGRDLTGYTVEIIAGPGCHQRNTIASNTSNTLKVLDSWGTSPTSASMIRVWTGIDSYSAADDPTFDDWSHLEFDFQNVLSSLGHTSGDNLGALGDEEFTWADYAELNGDVDTTAPTADIVSLPDFTSLAEGTEISKNRDLTVYISAADAGGVNESYAQFDADGDGTLDADETVAAEWNAATGVFEATITGIAGPAGDRALTALVFDTTGNYTLDTVSVTVTHDYSLLAEAFVEAGRALQEALPDLPSDLAIPFLDDHLSDVVDLTSTFARISDLLYDDAEVTGTALSTFDFETVQTLIVTLDGGDPLVVTIEESNADTLTQLVDTLNAALTAQGLHGLLTAVESGTSVALNAVDTAVRSMQITTLTLAAGAPTISYGQLTGDLNFQLSVSRDEDYNSGTLEPDVYTIHVEAAAVGDGDSTPSSADNALLSDLADDLNDALAVAGAVGILAWVDTTTGNLRFGAADAEITGFTLTDCGTGLSTLGFSGSLAAAAGAPALGFDRSQFVADLRITSLDDLALSTVFGDLLIAAGITLPDGFEVNAHYESADETVEFNFAWTAEYDQMVELNLGDAGFDLKLPLAEDPLSLEAAALAEAAFHVDLSMDFRVGIFLGDLDAEWSLDSSTLLSELNGGAGVGILVGMTADNAAPSDGQIGSDLSFTLDVEREDTGENASYPLTLYYSPSTTDHNRPASSDNFDVASLVSDLNLVLEGAGLKDIIQADAYTAEDDHGRVTEQRLMLRAVQLSAAGLSPIRGLTIRGGEPLGFGTGQDGNFADLSITVDSGTSSTYDIDLDGVRDLGDVIAAIEAQTSNAVEAEVNADGTGLSLSAEGLITVASGFTLARYTANSDDSDDEGLTASAATGLGLSTTETYGTVTGASLHGLALADRIYFTDGSSGSPGISFTARVAAGLDASAALGCLGLSLTTADDISFTVTAAAAFTDPQPGDGGIYLREILDSPGTVIDLSGATLSASAEGTITVSAGAVELDPGDGPDLLAQVAGGTVPVLAISVVYNEDDGFHFTTDGNFEDLVGRFTATCPATLFTALSDLADGLQGADWPALNVELPVLDKSLGDLISFGDGLVDAASRFVLEIDLPDVELALGNLDAAIANLSATYADRDDLSRISELLWSLTSEPQRPVQEANERDEDYQLRLEQWEIDLGDFDVALPSRLLSGLILLAKTIGHVPDGTIGKPDLETAFADLAVLLPSWNGVADRLEVVLEDVLGDYGFEVDVQLGFVDYDGDTLTEDTAAVVGMTISRSYQEGLEPELPASEGFGPVSLEGDYSLDLDAGGSLSLGFGVTLGASPTTFVIVDPDGSNPDLVKTELTVNAGFYGTGHGNVSLGSLDVVEADALLGLSQIVHEDRTVSGSVVVLQKTPLNQDVQFVVVTVGGSALPADQFSLRVDETGTSLVFTGLAEGTAVAVDYRAAAELNVAFDAGTSNAIGAVALGSLFDESRLNTTTAGEIEAALDVTFLGNTVEDAVTLNLDLGDWETPPELQVDTEALLSLFTSLDFDLSMILTGLEQLLHLLKEGLTSQVVTQLPLVGDAFDTTGTFLGKLETLVGVFRDELDDYGGDVEAAKMMVKNLIVDQLGDILKDRDGDGVPDAGDGVLDPGDVDVVLDAEHFEIYFELSHTDEVSLDMDLGLDGLPLSAEGQGGLEFSWTYDIKFGVGVNREQGFYFLADNSGTPEFSIDVDAGLAMEPSGSQYIPTSLTFDLFGLKLSATDNGNTATGVPATGLKGTVELNLAADGDGHVPLGDLAHMSFGDIFNSITFTGSAAVDLILEAGLNSNLPSLQTELKAGCDAELALVDGTWETTVTCSSLELVNTGVNLGKFLSQQVGAVVDRITQYLEPIEPVIRLLKTKVPGVSQLSEAAGKGSVTFLELALAKNPDAAAMAEKFVDALDILLQLSDSLQTLDDGSTLFTLMDNLALPAASAGNPDWTQDESLVEDAVADSGGQSHSADESTGTIKSLLQQIEELGLHLHFLEIENVVRMLLGQPFDVISYELPRFELPFEWSQKFGVWSPPPISIKVGLNAEIFADLSVGYDSHGLDTGNFFDGFYFGDRAQVFAGEDIDEFGLGVGVSLAALLDLVVASAGVEGEIRADVLANFRDLDGDGKIHLDELEQIVNCDGMSCVFDLTGEVRALVSLVWEALGAEGSYTFVDEVLFSFQNTCPTYELGHVAEAGEELPDGKTTAAGETTTVAGTLVLHAGAFADLRGPGTSSDVAESFTVTELASGVYHVAALGLESTYAGVSSIFFDGGAGNDALILDGVNVSVTAYGGDGVDQLAGGSQIDYLDGGSGDDLLSGGDADDKLVGGSGDDILDGGAGIDTIEGDSGNDTITGGDGGDFLYGGDGDDLIRAGTGVDTVSGGSGNDQIFGGTDGDQLDGDAGDDLLLGEADDDTICGGSGGDLISGGSGSDEIHGDSGNDMLVGGLIDANEAQQELIATSFGIVPDRLECDTDAGTETGDQLWGGTGNDLLIGDAGADYLYGGWGNDVILANLILDGTSTLDEYIEGGPDDDFVCGSQGQDKIYGGTTDVGLDDIRAELGGETYGGPQSSSCYATPSFMIAETGTMSGRVFLDADQDGVRDTGESGLAGWTVQLRDSEGDIAASVLTTASGTYTFSGVAYGTYSVAQVLSDGYVQSTPATGTHTITLSAGGTLIDLDFGDYFQGGEVRGYKFHDVNGNGVRDSGESYLNGWQFQLLDENGSVVATAVTTDYDLNHDGTLDPVTEHGVYVFSQVTPGTYTVSETPRSSWIQSYPVLSTGDASSGDAGYSFVNITDDGYTPTRSTAMVSGLSGPISSLSVSVDIEHPAVGQLTAYLLSPSGTRIRLITGVGGEMADLTAVTFADVAATAIDAVPAGTIYTGAYRPQGYLDDLIGEDPNGVWTLVIQDSLEGDAGRLNAWSLTISTPSTTAVEFEGGSPSPFTPERLTCYDVTVATGDSLQRDFGSYRTGSVSGKKFIDANGDHQQGIGEGGLPFVTIYADLNDNGQLDRQEPSTTSAADDPDTEQNEVGSFELLSLPPGNYVIREVAVPLMVQTYPSAPPGAMLPAGYVVKITSGSKLTSLVFGNQPLGDIRGTKWLDQDGDGMRDDVEPGLPGITLYADLNHNGQLDANEPSTKTRYDNPATVNVNETGQYVLGPLTVGPYVIREVVPPGFIQTYPAAAALGQHTVDVGARTTVRGVDFGNFLRDEGVCGQKYEDRNGNGQRDQDEPGLAGVTIYADLNNNGQWDANEPSTTTQADNPATGQVNETGRYCLQGITPGTVVIREVVPVGYKQTAGGRETVYVANFDQPAGPGNPVGDEWSTDRVTVAPLNQRAFLGLFDSETVTLNLHDLPAHDTLYVSFDLIVAGSWNGSQAEQGPDRWQLRTGDGLTLLDTTFSNTGNSLPTWQNPVDTDDIDANGYITPSDVLTLINKINNEGMGPLPIPSAMTAGQYHYYDTSGEGQLTPLDALHVINRLNGANGGVVGTGKPLGAGQGNFFPQAFPDAVGNTTHAPRTGAVENDTLGYDVYDRDLNVIGYQPADAVYHLTFAWPHNASSAVLDFTALGLSNNDADFEKWGLDNVVIAVPSTAHTVQIKPGQTVKDLDFGNQLTHQEPSSDLDYGDAPDPKYPTLVTSDGARHTIVADVYLGSYVDPDADGQPTGDALGDDLEGDDDDGVRFVSQFVAGTPVQLEVTASKTGFLNAWADFNGDGDWADEGEHFIADRTLNPGTSSFSTPVPMADLPPEFLYTRFRFSTQAGLSPSGTAPDGEVEDYRVDMHQQNPANAPQFTARSIVRLAASLAAPAAAPAEAEQGANDNNNDNPNDPDPDNPDGDPLPVNEIHGLKWRDSNGDGVRQSTEPGLAGVTIYADLDNDKEWDGDEPYDVTHLDNPATPGDELGTYALTGLPGGTIIVREIVPAGYVQTYPVLGYHTIVLIYLHSADDVNFGNWPIDAGQNVVSGTKWNDATGDLGVRNADDPGLAGVTVYVDLNKNEQWDVHEPKAVTREDDPATPADETGQYKILNVPSGQFFVREVVPTGWVCSYPATPYRVTLTGATIASHLDFGNYEYEELQDGDDVIYAGAGNDLVWGDNVVTDPRIASVGTRQDTLYGEAGDDELHGQERDDVLCGGADPDRLLDGGEDEDRVLQTSDQMQVLADDAGVPGGATLQDGTDMDQLLDIEHATLTGEAGNNTIDAGGFTYGSVILIGAAGDDTLKGTSLDDDLQGGNGNDTLVGNAGDDELDGGAGDDTLDGGAGDDHYVFVSATSAEADAIIEYLGMGTDHLDFSALPATDPVVVDLTRASASTTPHRTLTFPEPPTGTLDIENITGGAGNDAIVGGEADNYFIGGPGNDHLAGGLGDDTLDGGADADVLTGGPGPGSGYTDDDQFLMDAGWGVGEILSDSGGYDTLDLSSLTAGLILVFDTTSGLSVTDGTNTLTHSANTVERIRGGQGDDQYVFHDQATLAPDGGSHEISDGAGTDWLDFSAYGSSVTVDLSGNSATTNALRGGMTVAITVTVTGCENVRGGSAGDSLTGDSLPNVLVGNGGDDHLVGLDGKDTLDGGAGGDAMEGGLGSDTYLFGLTVGTEADQVDEAAGAGNDTLDFGSMTEAVQVDLNSAILAASAHRTVTVPLGDWANFERVVGTPLDDVLIPNGNNNRLAGGDGRDTYVIRTSVTGTVTLVEEAGGAADSSLGGEDTIDFGSFTTTVTFDLSAEVNTPTTGLTVNLRNGSGQAAPENFEDLRGGTGNDTLTGNDRDNVLDGGDGDDKLRGLRGNDRLLGGAGNNDLFGGVGDDTYVFVDATVAGNTKLYEDAGTVVSGMLSPGGTDTVDLSALTSTVTFNLANAVNTIGLLTITLRKTLPAAAPENFEIVIGSISASNTLTGNAASNLLVGGNLSDTLTGGGGDDILIGRPGNDTLGGDDGRDLLFGGYGSDQLDGGAGDDILAGGGLSYNAPLDRAALDAIRTAWLSSRDYAARQASLLAGVGPDDECRIDADTYLADAVADQLLGQTEIDWFLTDGGLDTTDVEPGETVRNFT